MEGDLNISPSEIKLIHKGKVISCFDDETDSGSAISSLYDSLTKGLSKKKTSFQEDKKTIIRVMAMGVPLTEVKEIELSKANAPRIRDDLSKDGRRQVEERQRLGRKMLADAAKKDSTRNQTTYGFGRIETLPMLPDQNRAKEILNSLANDPGILACMAKHKWNVGCLAELFPEGKVGESPVTVMGLNQNKGSKILLRLRTDDLSGFRKILNIKKVLYHELAHNVHSEHDENFFQLMRQIEKECNEMDWTEGAGFSTTGIESNMTSFQGGTYRLGGDEQNLSQTNVNIRELAARAALMRMSKEEQEIQDACGCGRLVHNNISTNAISNSGESKTTNHDIKDDDDDKV